MKKLLFLCLIGAQALWSQQTDIYFGNGILTTAKEADKNTQLLSQIIYDSLPKNLTSLIHEVKRAYNTSEGQLSDILESAGQKTGWYSMFAGPIEGIDEGRIEQLREKMIIDNRRADLSEQLLHYRQSIDGGYRVLVVAHSQGNLYANDLYKLLGSPEDDFSAVSVASPMQGRIKPDTPQIAFDNDVVPLLGIYTAHKIQNEVRKTDWKFIKFTGTPRPDDFFVRNYQIKKGMVYKGEWKAVGTSIVHQYNAYVHAFRFYMGRNLLKDDKTGEEFINPFDGKPLNTPFAKNMILSAIKSQLELNAQAGGDNGTDPGSGDTNTTNPGNGGDSGSGTELPNYKKLCPDINYPQNLSNAIVDQINNLIKTSLKDPDICEKIKNIIETAGSIPGL